MYAYSSREKTPASRMKDTVSEDEKFSRLKELMALHDKINHEIFKAEIGKYHLVLLEKISKKSKDAFKSRSDSNKRIIVPKELIKIGINGSEKRLLKLGDFVLVKIESLIIKTLIGKPICIISDMNEYFVFIEKEQKPCNFDMSSLKL